MKAELELNLTTRICPDVLEEGRERFGGWRYFESVIGERALLALTSPALSRSLLKSARVLLDEGTSLGLSGSVNMEARQDVRVIDENRRAKYSYQLEGPRRRICMSNTEVDPLAISALSALRFGSLG